MGQNKEQQQKEWQDKKYTDENDNLLKNIKKEYSPMFIRLYFYLKFKKIKLKF